MLFEYNKAICTGVGSVYTTLLHAEVYAGFGTKRAAFSTFGRRSFTAAGTSFLVTSAIRLEAPTVF